MTPRTRYLFPVLFIVWLLLIIAAARAHDHLRPDLTPWLNTLKSKKGELCCTGNDYDAIEDWDSRQGRYRVKFRGNWYDVPDDAIITEPNKTGDVMVWMNKGFSGISVRCFMPGIET